MAYVEDNRKSHYGEPVVVRYRGEKGEIYAILAIGSSEYTAKNPNNRYQYIDPGLMEKLLHGELEGRVAADEKMYASIGLGSEGAHERSAGHYTSARTINSIEEEILAVDAEVFAVNEKISDESSARQSDKTQIIEAVGLSETGNYKTMGYYYTTGATSVSESIKLLDSKLHDIETFVGKSTDAKTKNTVFGYINKMKAETDSDVSELDRTLEMVDGKFKPYTVEDGTKYINNQNSIRDEIRALDFAIQNLAKAIEEIHADINKN